MNKRSSCLFSIICALALILNLPPPIPAFASTSIFINEIHYDNSGADSGEAIEIAGLAGFDLTGYRLMLYNGNTGILYNTTILSGVIPDQQNGFGTISSFIAGILNTGPAGIALVDPTNTLIQFLSYEGTFTGSGGPVDGIVSTDIGVSEDGTGEVGMSLQLTGTGTIYDDFIWAADAPNTFGAINTDQAFSNGPAPTDPSGTGAANPDLIHASDTTLLSVVVTPGENPTSTGLTVECDLTDIGGLATQALYDDGTNGDVTSIDNTFSYLATVNGGTSTGQKNLPCTITDDYPRSGNTSISLSIVAEDHFFLYLPLLVK
jgi:hypothetical protein